MFYPMSPFESNPKNNGIETDLWKISENNYEDNWNLNSSDLNRVDFFVLQESKEEIIPFVDDRMGVFEPIDNVEFEQSINCENDVLSSKLLDFSREEIKFPQISAQCTAQQSLNCVQCENQIYEVYEACLNSNKKSDVEKIKHRRKRVDTGMVKRKDQVIRDLIRKIKRTYKRCFYDATDYLKLSHQHSLQQLHQSLVAFVYNSISQIDSEQIAFALGCMTFPMKMSDMIHKNCFTFISNLNKSTYEQMLETIQRPFKRFNSKNLRSFINCGDIATLLIHFPEICVPFALSEDEAVGFGMIEDECMIALTS